MASGGGMALVCIAVSAVAAWLLRVTLRTGRMQDSYFLPDRAEEAHPVLYWFEVAFLAIGVAAGPILAVALIRQPAGSLTAVVCRNDGLTRLAAGRIATADQPQRAHCRH